MSGLRPIVSEPTAASLAPSSRSLPQSFLAFDFGLKRVGVASGNRILGQAQPLLTVTEEGDARFARIGELIAQWQPDALVVGVPFHPDGAEHDNTRRARRFARQLHGRFGMPVHEVDERYSTVEAQADAHAGGAGTSRLSRPSRPTASKGSGPQDRGPSSIDARAAAVILQQFLEGLV